MILSLVEGRECYECSSTSSSGCNSTQNRVVCKEHQHSCLTIQYQYKILVDGKSSIGNKLKKKCADRKFDCKVHCRLYEKLGMKNCQVNKINY